MITSRPTARFVQSQRLLTVDETRGRLGGICRNTLRSLETVGKLIPRRIEKRVLYRESDVNAFITAGSGQKASQSFEKGLALLDRSLGSVNGLSLDSDSLQSRSTPDQEKPPCPAWGFSQLDFVVPRTMRQRRWFVPLDSPSRDSAPPVSGTAETVD
jgi:hypothetical protein